jgi:uncharacterized membrane-anchored protein
MESSFQKANKEIGLLENEIKHKQKEIKKLKSSPIKTTIKSPMKKPTIIKKFFGQSDKNIEREIKRKQIEITNLKKETHQYYDAPKVTAPKRPKIEVVPKNKPIKKEEFIHHVDNMDRIKERIRTRRINI